MNRRLPGLAARTEDTREFRVRFKRSLRRCMAKGFLAEECFGVIWEETLDEVYIDDPDQQALFAEMIHWAKKQPR